MIKKAIKNLSLFSILFIVFYFRKDIFNIPSLFFIPFFLIILFLDFVDFRNLKIYLFKVSKLHFIICILIFLGLIWNTLLYGEYIKYIFLFFIEVIVNLGVYYYFYCRVLNKNLFIIKVSKLLILGALIFPVPKLFEIALSLKAVRRIGSDISMPVAANHLGHSLAIVAFILFVFYLFNENLFKLINFIGFIVVVCATLLTGSRGAIFPLLIVMGFCIVKITDIKSSFATILFLIVSIIFIYNFVDTSKYLSLLKRFNFDMIKLGISNRIRSFEQALNNFHFYSDILLGTGWHKYYEYHVYGVVENYISYPHNIMLSIFIYFGFPIMLLFFILFLREWFFLFRRIIFIDMQDIIYDVLLFGYLNISFLYMSTSGGITRTITIFIALGMISGYRKNIKKGYIKSKGG